MSKNVVPIARAPLASGERPTAIVPTTIEQVWRLAELAARSGLAPRDMQSAEKCAVAILHGLEVGLPPMQSLQRIAVINGRPTIWGDAALGLVRASGLLEAIKEEVNGNEAVCTVKRAGEEAVSRTFSIADATAAGLWRKQGPWTQYPKRMLQMRARAFALRDVFADVLGGLYLTEELQGNGGASPEPPTPATIETIIEYAEAPTTQPVDDEPPTPPEPEHHDFDEEQWLRDLEGACSGASDLDELRKVQIKVQLPARTLVSPDAWEKGKAILVDRSAVLAADEEPPDQ